MTVIEKSFYLRNDVVKIAKDLIGISLCTNFDSELTVGVIVETEAYKEPEDKASHALIPKKRAKVMFPEGGIAHVYLFMWLQVLPKSLMQY